MSEGIILPGNIDVKRPLSDAQLIEAEKAQERHELNAELAGRLSPLPPYHPAAPVCDTAWWQNQDGLATKHHGIVPAPVWAHGRCIGPACVRWARSFDTCGRVLQDLAAAVAIGAMTPDEARFELADAALPPPGEEGADA